LEDLLPFLRNGFPTLPKILGTLENVAKFSLSSPTPKTFRNGVDIPSSGLKKSPFKEFPLWQESIFFPPEGFQRWTQPFQCGKPLSFTSEGGAPTGVSDRAPQLFFHSGLLNLWRQPHVDIKRPPGQFPPPSQRCFSGETS